MYLLPRRSSPAVSPQPAPCSRPSHRHLLSSPGCLSALHGSPAIAGAADSSAGAGPCWHRSSTACSYRCSVRDAACTLPGDAEADVHPYSAAASTVREWSSRPFRRTPRPRRPMPPSWIRFCRIFSLIRRQNAQGRTPADACDRLKKMLMREEKLQNLRHDCRRNFATNMGGYHGFQLVSPITCSSASKILKLMADLPADWD